MKRNNNGDVNWHEKIIRWVSERKVTLMGIFFISVIYLLELYLFHYHLAQTEYLAKLQMDQKNFLCDSILELPKNITTQIPKVVKLKPKIKSMKRSLPPVTQPFPPAPPKRAPGPDTRYLVYLCPAKPLCGGWGDRQKGLTSVYLLSRVTDREFRIIMGTPCDLTNFFIPNIVPWIPTEDELKTDSTVTLRAISNRTVTKIIGTLDFNDRFPQKVIYFRTNSDYYYDLRDNKVYSDILSQWSALGDKKTRFRWAWNDLMKPTERVLKALQRLVGPRFLIDRGLTKKSVTDDKDYMPEKEVGNSSLICAHVRIGRNPNNPKDNEIVKFKFDDIPALYEFMQEKSNGQDCRFFVATDYDFVRSMTKAFFGDKAVQNTGKILHIDRQRKDNEVCSAFEIAVAEQMLLSLCDHLIVSDSGFSVHAAFLSNSSFGQVYKMEKGKAKVIM